MASEGFSGRFGRGSDEVMEGVCTLAADFLAVLWDVEWYLLFKDPLLCWDWPLETRVIKRNEMKRVESRRNHVVSQGSLVFF